MSCLCCVTSFLSEKLKIGMLTCCYTSVKLPRVVWISIVLTIFSTRSLIKPVKHTVSQERNAHQPKMLNTLLFSRLFLFSALVAHYPNIMRQTRRPGFHQALSTSKSIRTASGGDNVQFFFILFFKTIMFDILILNKFMNPLERQSALQALKFNVLFKGCQIAVSLCSLVPE